MPLLLFDIDGTLLHVREGVHEAVLHAIATTAGVDAETEGISFSGRTDPAIFRDVLRNSGISNPDPFFPDVLDRYAQTARETIEDGSVAPLSGIPTLLSHLRKHKNVVLGLLTGNVESVAYHKLQRAGIAAPFATGAFGSDDADRNNLPAIALRRVAQEYGRSLRPENTIIIGDTQHDIQCARSAGMQSVAVCTGRFTRQELATYNPDLLLEDMADPTAVIGQLLRM